MFDLKTFRRQNKLTQIDAANLFGCAQSFISQIEKGKRPIPDDFISIIKANKKYKIEDIIEENSTLPGIVCTNPECLNKIEQLKRELNLANMLIESHLKNIKHLEKENEQLKSEKGASEPGKRGQGSVEKPGENKKAS